MELLQAVNTVLPHLGEHTITRVEGAKHPTVDLIVAAIDRQRMEVLAEGLWFNMTTMTIPVNTDGQIDVPANTVSVYGYDYNVELDGTKFIDLSTGSRYFLQPITVTIVRDVEFNRLPVNVALAVTYRAGAEVYLQDYGREGTVPELQNMATQNWNKVHQEDLRKNKFNSQRTARRRNSSAVRFR